MRSNLKIFVSVLFVWFFNFDLYFFLLDQSNQLLLLNSIQICCGCADQTKGAIDSHSTDRLGVILKVAEQLRGGGGGGGGNATTDRPNFLWLIRDHQLKMTGAPRDEMLSKIGDAERSALERCFATNDCFPLPRPVDKESDLQRVEEMEYAALREDFKEECKFVLLQIVLLLFILSSFLFSTYCLF